MEYGQRIRLSFLAEDMQMMTLTLAKTKADQTKKSTLAKLKKMSLAIQRLKGKQYSSGLSVSRLVMSHFTGLVCFKLNYSRTSMAQIPLEP